MSMLRRILTIAAIAAGAALAPAPAAAQSSQQLQETGDAFYYRGTGGVPPVERIAALIARGGLGPRARQ
jgi:ABC-type oligopeptide transport system substrate-binding subunit